MISDYNKQQEFIGHYCFAKDISDRKQAEQTIREQAALLDLTTDAIIVRDLESQIQFWNQGAARIYGWQTSEVSGQDLRSLLYQEVSPQIEIAYSTVLETDEWHGELRKVTKTGKEVIVASRWTLVRDEAGNPRFILSVDTDITEQKLLETQFLRAQRLESLGTLAGGIAHDLNNIFTPILGFSKLLPVKLANVDEQTKEVFKIIETNAQRGSALVKQILTFSRGMEGERGIVQIRHLITEIKQIIEGTFPKTIQLETSVPKNLWTVNADVNQLHQVLMNLVVNARDAMPQGGKLKITAENFTINENFARLYLDAQVGDYILISVADTGVGIPAEIIDRIFEPFFTTKEIDRGTGLGLSTLIGIVKSHGGFVDVESNTNSETRGTLFKVFLPASETAETNLEETESIPQGNGELILVVDDEPSILEVTKAILETCNYRVLPASNGIEAIAIYAQNQNAIELVIMDIMMPSMDGKTAIRILKTINSEAKIIAVSGSVYDQEIIAETNSSIEAFIAKPYTNNDLLKVINEVINF
ncbi:MAG: hybrid sensor histidine kinase/response regulator, partial [Waterburya sp.]